MIIGMVTMDILEVKWRDGTIQALEPYLEREALVWFLAIITVLINKECILVRCKDKEDQTVPGKVKVTRPPTTLEPLHTPPVPSPQELRLPGTITWVEDLDLILDIWGQRVIPHHRHMEGEVEEEHRLHHRHHYHPHFILG